MKDKTMKNKKGFTLIELLVVVAIIAVLAAISVVALNNARARARDSKRLADIKQIQTALELYYLDQNGYPSDPGASPDIEGKCLSSNGFENSCSAGATVYMAQVPSAPEPCDCTEGCNATYGDMYSYAVQGSSPYTTYTLQYCLGKASGGILEGVRTATPAGISD